MEYLAFWKILGAEEGPAIFFVGEVQILKCTSKTPLDARIFGREKTRKMLIFRVF